MLFSKYSVVVSIVFFILIVIVIVEVNWHHTVRFQEVLYLEESSVTREMVPIPRRASSFLVVVFIHFNRKEEEEDRTSTTVYQRL